MSTTHEVARALLQLPDVELLVEGWCGEVGVYPVMTQYDPEGTAILVGHPVSELRADEN